MGGGPGPSIRGDGGPRVSGGAQFSQRGSGNWNGRWDGRRRHFNRFPRFAFGFGGYPFYDDDYYAYAAPACEYVRVRHVRPNGRVVWRTVERCY